MRKKIKLLSLFAGAGGLDLGFLGGFTFRNHQFDNNWYRVVFANDNDPAAELVYNSNKSYFYHKMVRKNVEDIPNSDIPDFDVMLAGFPCQPFSSAGNRKGVHDDRGTLFEECVRIIEEGNHKGRQVRAFVFENVRGISSTYMPNGLSVPEEIKRRMKKLGFNTVYKLLKTSDYGAPTNRYRLIMVGLREELGEFDFSSMDQVVKEFDIPSAKVDSRELLLGSILSDIPEKSAQFNDVWNYSPSGQTMVENIGPCEIGKEGLEFFRNGLTLSQMPAEITKGRSWKNLHRDQMTPRFLKIWDNPKKYRAPNFYRRFALGEINGTITASAQPENCGITHPFEDRRFSVRECARIQSFPDEFEFPNTTLPHAYKVIGNAVPPVFGWVLARALYKFI